MDLMLRFQELKQKIESFAIDINAKNDLLEEVNAFEKYLNCYENEINEKCQKFEDFVNHSPDIIYQFSSKRGGLFWSNSVKDILGYTPEDLINNPFIWNNSIHPNDKQNVEKAIKNYEEGDDYNVEYRIRTKSGKWIWLHDFFMHKIYVNDEIIIEGHASDISQRKELEIALSESETKFKEIIQQTHDGVVVFNDQKRIIVWNKGSENIFGVREKDALEKSIVDIQFQFAPPHLKNRELIESVVEGIVTLKTPEVFYKIIDNETIVSKNKTINLQSIVFPIKIGNQHLFCSIFRDTTEIKEYEKQLLKLNADKDRFITILAHDIKSPFSGMLGLLELLKKKVRSYDIEKTENRINLIYEIAQNTSYLLDEILLWISVNSGKIPFEPKEFNAKYFCDEIINIMKPNAELKGISINNFLPEELTTFSDKNMLKAVFQNLIANAIKFTNNGGQIVILAEKNINNVTFTVSDNGIGIEPDTLNKLFDMSQTLSTEGTENEKGTGFGLLLCKEFVEKHGGRIWVESEVGKGSDFKFVLPLNQEMTQ